MKHNNINQSENEIFSSLTKSFSKDSLQLFLRELYKCLIGRSQNASTESNLSKTAFEEYLSFPLIISERLFSSFTSVNPTQEISIEDFVNGFSALYLDNMGRKIDLISKICDFDLDGVVNVDDITLLFERLYIIDNGINDFNELKAIIHQKLSPKKMITISSLKEMMNNHNSDIVYLFMLFFNRYCPFTVNQVKYFESSYCVPLLSNQSSSSKTSSHTVMPSKMCMDYIRKHYLKSKPNESGKEEENNIDDCNDLSDLDVFETDLLQAISTLNMNNEENGDNNSYCQYKTTHNKDINSTMNKVFVKSSAQTPMNNNAKEEEYERVKSLAMDSSKRHRDSEQSIIIFDYDNTNHYYEIKANYYTRNGIMKNCKIILIDDCLFIHTLNDSYFKYNKIIPLKDLWIEEIEDCETLSQNILKRVKLISYLNSFHKEIIFSSQDELEMSFFIMTLKGIITKYNKNIDELYFRSREIFRGPYSQILLGKNIKTNESIVIKQIKHSAICKTKNYQLALWERDILRFVQQYPHSNVGKIYDLYRTCDSFYFIAEYFSGGDLKNYLIENRKKLSVAQLKSIIYQITDAVLFLHSHNIIHRDLKPENIVLSKSFREKNNGMIDIKIIDFGFARVLGTSDYITESFGTLNYAAPEILNRVPYNFKADIWSLGVLIYVIVIGSHPFGETDKDIKTIHFNIINCNYTIPSHITSPYKEIILNCLKLNPKERPKPDDIIRLLIN